MTTPTVLFMCVHNAGRSQMAAGFLRALAGDAITVLSAGSHPGSRVNPKAVAVMAEEGIDISGAAPRFASPDLMQAADVVVTMGCGDDCTWYPGKRYLDWELTDPAGQDIDVIRTIRDDIKARVTALADELLP